MKKQTLLLSIVILTGLIGGCSLFNKTDETTTTQASPTPQPSPPPPIPSPQPFKSPTQPGTNPGQVDVGGLIPSTNPNEVKVKKGRSDPFAVVPVKPIITTKPSQIQPGKNPPTSTETPTVKQPNSNQTTVTTNPPIKGPPTITGRQTTTGRTPNYKMPKEPILPPPPPDPTEAKGVMVSGIVALSNQPMAIIKAPGESVTRAVPEGAMIANGQVLVKAIYTNADSPIVVLEQYGVEVTKKIGEAPPQTNPSPSSSPSANPQAQSPTTEPPPPPTGS